MTTMRSLAFRTGRALALLAAMMLALVPALPAHAHPHHSHDAAAHAALAHAGEVAVDPPADHEPRPASHAGECCLSSHVSVLPAAASLLLPVSLTHAPSRTRDLAAPPDALLEALPEPPRPFA